jgi:hypothetical protein
MPPKENHEPIYIEREDGYEIVGKITDIPNLCSENSNSTPYMHAQFSDKPIRFVVELKKPIDSRMMIFLLTGRWLSNNWLRMHGYPMARRCGFHRRKRK